MFNVKFKRYNGELVDLGDFDSELASLECIYTFCETHKYKIPYIRCNKYDDYSEYDVGSHTEFFEVRKNG